MGRMHVAYFEARALSCQTARPERRKTPLVRDLGQGIGLIHELAELRGTEELAHGRSRWLGVDQIVGHDRVDIDRTHALLDRPLHAQQANAILIFHQFADRADAPVAEMVDVVHLAAAVAQVHQILDDRQNVLAAQNTDRVLRFKTHAHVHLHAADRRQVVAL